MTGSSGQGRGEVWALVARQHGVVARRQLIDLGFTRHAIAHRVADGRLHRVCRGIYAVGRPELSQQGRWMAAVLACDPVAWLSHFSAAGLWDIAPRPETAPHVSVPLATKRRLPGITLHRRNASWAAAPTVQRGIPVISVVDTLIDMAVVCTRDEVESAVNAADRRGLIDPVSLRGILEETKSRPGTRVLTDILDRRTFTLTESQLERRFLPLARRAGLPPPVSQARVNGFRVDFHWPDLGLVVETDGLTYHRTPAQQAADRVRDQVHAAAGLTPLRFTRAQVRFEPGYVQHTLAAVARRLRRRGATIAASDR